MATRASVAMDEENWWATSGRVVKELWQQWMRGLVKRRTDEEEVWFGTLTYRPRERYSDGTAWRPSLTMMRKHMRQMARTTTVGLWPGRCLVVEEYGKWEDRGHLHFVWVGRDSTMLRAYVEKWANERGFVRMSPVKSDKDDAAKYAVKYLGKEEDTFWVFAEGGKDGS